MLSYGLSAALSKVIFVVYYNSGLIEAMEQYIAAFESYLSFDPNNDQLNTMRDFCRNGRQQVWEREAQEKADRIQKYWEIHSEEK